MHVLVTGGNGFIGKHLVAALEKAGVGVTVVDSSAGEKRVKDINHLDGIDFIFHLAATPRVSVSRKYPKQSISNNVNSTLHLLELVRLNPSVKMLNISSSSAKFADTSQNPYALSKLMGEQMVWTYKQTYGLELSTVRLFNVYGPGEREAGDESTTLVRACKTAVINNTPLKVTAKGSTSRDFTHVEDVVSGLIRIMNLMVHGPSYLPLYELGSGEAIKIGTVIRSFANICGMRIEMDAVREGDADTTYAHKSYAVPGWRATHNIHDYVVSWKERGCPDD